MNNKEAADNYADDIATTEERGWMDRSDIYAIARDAYLACAEWKDQQFKEYLEKKKLQYATPNGRYWYTPDDYTMRKWFTRCITEILRELFPND